MNLKSPLLASLVPLFVVAVLASACGASKSQVTPSPTATRAPDTASTSTIPVGAVVGFASITIGQKAESRLARLSIVPSQPVVAAGNTLVFSVLAYDATGHPIPFGDLEVQWYAIDPQVGAITSAGIFRAGAQQGFFDKAIQVTVTQTAGGGTIMLQGLASVSVIRPLSESDINRVEALPSSVQLEPNTETSLAALAVDVSGVPVPGVNYTWAMLNPAAGTITAAGQFTAGTQEGTFPLAIRVVAQKISDPTQTASATISVTIQALVGVQAASKVNLYPQSVSIRPGAIVDFKAIALDPRGNLVNGGVTVWRLKDPLAGDIDSQGRFHAGPTPGTFPGVVEVTLGAGGADPSVLLKATATVTILSPAETQEQLANIIVAPQVVRLHAGASQRINATILTNLGHILPSALVHWSGDPNVVQVGQDGLVTAVGKPGTYQNIVSVTATASAGNQVVTRSATISVIILGPLSRVDVVPQEANVTPQQTVQFTFLAYDTNGVRLFDVVANWQVRDPAAGSIDNLGFLTVGTKPGRYQDVIRVSVMPLLGSQGGG